MATILINPLSYKVEPFFVRSQYELNVKFEKAGEPEYEAEFISGTDRERQHFAATGNKPVQFFDREYTMRALDEHKKAIVTYLAAEQGYPFKRALISCECFRVYESMEQVFDYFISSFDITERHPLYMYINEEEWIRDQLLNSQYLELKADKETFAIVHPNFLKGGKKE